MPAARALSASERTQTGRKVFKPNPRTRHGFEQRRHHLQGDHIWPYSLFGETIWSNYQLICGSCNAAKGNRLEGDVRKILGDGEFRRMVREFIQRRVESGDLAADSFIRQLLDGDPKGC